MSDLAVASVRLAFHGVGNPHEVCVFFEDLCRFPWIDLAVGNGLDHGLRQRVKSVLKRPYIGDAQPAGGTVSSIIAHKPITLKPRHLADDDWRAGLQIGLNGNVDRHNELGFPAGIMGPALRKLPLCHPRDILKSLRPATLHNRTAGSLAQAIDSFLRQQTLHHCTSF
ncbi:hypothetical protein [Martelella sp. UBA3392]|uniref:hypothetical protein n=1 Tax=Martelella sp. UBA3392 TaxID=1946834 RepID=UPI0031F5C901